LSLARALLGVSPGGFGFARALLGVNRFGLGRALRLDEGAFAAIYNYDAAAHLGEDWWGHKLPIILRISSAVRLASTSGVMTRSGGGSNSHSTKA
jgi:hypothetical protein